MLGLNGKSHGPYIEIDETPRYPWLAYVVQIDPRGRSYVPFRTLRNMVGRAFPVRNPTRAFEQRQSVMERFGLSNYDVVVYAVEEGFRVNRVPLFSSRKM